eukprot:CAMPEP_0177581492 /NCGR_PEP_ID=MMETSP0419_2-20121207/2177_1 /TAXON_ID=582737 /ORGANISM="Tetraselmis sp., Strain GSL018" /LENGTH=108 /DNA_ID=CAMNT_0019070539 /DNA_START=274 /DNA_END=598 /DNA_ORIENTATION=+
MGGHQGGTREGAPGDGELWKGAEGGREAGGRAAARRPEVEVRHLQHQDAENVDTLRESLRVARGGAGDVRRGLPLRVCAVGARAELKQAPDHRLVAEPGRDVERREAV